jgi:hypothetical protein
MDSTKQDMLAAVGRLNGILEEDPQNPEALIYKGSILAKMASVDFWFWNRVGGYPLFGQPSSWKIRFLHHRAYRSVHGPSMDCV